MPVDPSPEARARALQRCAEIDKKYDEILGPEGRKRLDEIREQDQMFARLDRFIDKKHLQRQRKKEADHGQP